ncbi:uncharacterized protein EDB91DRAFT_1252314 [Suillus paluster]|uniref:uncharacterized protein n=1 Tax=Suillus paluster TaxID=48578 RepID=UPI001B86BDA5|nr:uncharacterized protein EDB91DRAFT_1252314 [Suillus paluster]KAG1731055.1 hypothetical protein EDB91DRAFT_1252314 [Suillus paluster]
MLTQSKPEIQARGNVLACTEASCKDTNSSARPKLSPNPIVTHVPTPLDTIITVDLYSVGHIAITKEQLEAKEAVPFIHQVILEGPKGEAVRVRALFDDGAMVAAMCTSVFKKVKHRLDNWAKWSGTIEINGVRAEGDLEVFDSGGGWAFLFGKPLLQSFKAEHNYQSDTIKIINSSQSTTIHNQVAHPQALQRAEHQGTSLTQDVKQQETPDDALRHHSSSSSSECNLQPTHPPTPPHTNEPAWRPSHIPMGQWKPSTMNSKQQEQWRLHQMWKRVPRAMDDLTAERNSNEEDNKYSQIMGSETLPSREVELDTPHQEKHRIDDSKVAEPPIPIQVLIEPNQVECKQEREHLGPQPQDIFTRHTWPNNPARVTKILLEITFGDNITIEEKLWLEDFVRCNADIFTLSLKEVKPIPNAYINLNVPEAATFNLRIHQRPLTPDQSRFFSAPTTVIAQKAHESPGLPWEELRQCINNQCRTAGEPPAFKLQE